jgi:hypothetical protein
MIQTTRSTDGLRRIARLGIAVLAVLAVIASPAAAGTPAADAPQTADGPASGDLAVDGAAAAGPGGTGLVHFEEESGGWRVAMQKFEDTSSY